MDEFAKNMEEIMGMIAKDAKEVLVGLTSDVTRKKLIEKDALINWLNYKLTRNEKRAKNAYNDEERRKLQYQREELIDIIENVKNM